MLIAVNGFRRHTIPLGPKVLLTMSEMAIAPTKEDCSNSMHHILSASWPIGPKYLKVRLIKAAEVNHTEHPDNEKQALCIETALINS